MINTSFSSSQATYGRRGAASSSDTTRGAFFNPQDRVEQAPEKPPLKRVSVEALKSELGLTGRQAKDLAALANVDYQEPFRAGRLNTDDGEVFLVTQKNFNLDPAGFQGYDSAFRVYAMEGNEVRELSIDRTNFVRDGSVRLDTAVGTFDLPARDKGTVCGYTLSKDLSGQQVAQ